MARITFDEVSIKATRRWKDASGKIHQETKKFWQTINPYNRISNGLMKMRPEILEELRAERDAWLREAPNA